MIKTEILGPDSQIPPDIKTSNILKPENTCSLPVGSQQRRPEDELVHWCHGAPGTVYLLARAWLTWREEKYLAALRQSEALSLVEICQDTVL